MTINILDEKQYPWPDTEYEERIEEIPAHKVSINDTLDANRVATVRRVSTGPKFATAFDTEGKQLFRLPKDEMVRVVRSYATQESRDRDRRATKNREVCKLFSKSKEKLPAVMKKLNADVKAYAFNGVDYQNIGSLLQAAAHDRVLCDFQRAMEYMASEEGMEKLGITCAADAWDNWAATIIERFTKVYGIDRAISRSTNQVSNLMEDCERVAYLTFLDNAKWW
jgi:hypothetical protein